jgi:hypothetical protein
MKRIKWAGLLLLYSAEPSSIGNDPRSTAKILQGRAHQAEADHATLLFVAVRLCRHLSDCAAHRYLTAAMDSAPSLSSPPWDEAEAKHAFPSRSPSRLAPFHHMLLCSSLRWASPPMSHRSKDH